MAKSKFGGLELEMAQVQNLKTWILDMPKSKFWANHTPDSFQISYTKIDTWDADCELPMVDSWHNAWLVTLGIKFSLMIKIT